MKQFRLFLLVLFVAPAIVFAQDNLEMRKTLPIDSAVQTGTLDNGLRYYIRVNHKPEHRAELRLVVNAGSVLEDDDQQGLAHFDEHMAFDGTKNFPKLGIINYLESIGMKFGADLNASTSFDETIYKMQIPTDSSAIVEKSFQVLEDWAHNVSYEDSAIDKERGVVIEEWRLGRGAEARMRDKQFPILFKDSRYAVRLPIGKHDIIQDAPYDALRRFYKTWYRPDLMAVVAVGDFDKAQIEKLIKSHFSGITNPTHEKPREELPVPDTKDPLFAVATDKEATNSRVTVAFKLDIEPEHTVSDYRRNIIEELYTTMLNDRLDELAQKANAPFLSAASFKERFVRTKAIYGMEATVKDNGIVHGLEAILTEAQRVKKFGFTQTELDREKKSLMSVIDQRYNERDKTQSGLYVSEYIRNFLDKEAIPGIAFEREIYQKYLDGITLAEVNALTEKWMPDKNCVVLANAPEKTGLTVPTEGELSDAFAKAANAPVTAYVDQVLDQPLVANIPTSGKVVSEKQIPEVGITEWMLSNGARVILKPTDFKNDEILFSSFSPGGTSSVPDADFIPTNTAASLVDESGLGNFNLTELQKTLAGKIVQVSPSISDLYEELSGSAAPKDMKTLFELIYSYYTQPRIDSDAVAAYVENMKTTVQNRSANPQAVWQDTLQVTLSQNHMRERPWTMDMLKKIDPQRSLAIYKQLYADASATTFMFVGNFTPDGIKPFVETYLGGLPAAKQAHAWKDLGIVPPKGVVEKGVHKGIEQKGITAVIFSGSFDWTLKNNHDISAMCSALEIKLRERLRSQESGVYFVQFAAQPKHQPRDEYSIVLAFPSDPKRSDELVKKAFEALDSIKEFGIDSIYVEKVRTEELLGREKNLKENKFWLGLLQTYYKNGMDPVHILDYPVYAKALTPQLIQEDAKKFIRDDNYVKVTLYPEGN